VRRIGANQTGAQFVDLLVMSEKRSKYDTDPLDPDFVRQADEMWGATRRTEPRATGDAVGNEQETIRLPGTPPPAPASEPQRGSAPRPTDAPTRRMDEQSSQSYPSIFVPPTYPQPPAPYQQPQVPYQQAPYQQQPGAYQQPYAPPHAAPAYYTAERPVAGIGLAEKWATALPYAPFYIGIVVALLELLLVPRHEVRARFHAAQGLALHLAILAIYYLFTIIGVLTGSRFGATLFGLASTIFLIVSMIRVWKGREPRIAPLSDATKWLNEHTNPRKS
jgi:uncharacterized membrane protein